MRKEISFHLKAKKIKNRLIMIVLLIIFFIFINGILIYTINPINSYFSFIKKIIPFPFSLFARASHSLPGIDSPE